jgi:catechol 2,3-dioxygenase-like lactoylglutathione lyase family enzyme
MAEEALQSRFRKIDCIHLHVADLEAGLSFYRDRLGLELIWRSQEAAGLRLPGSEAEIVLISSRSEPEIDFAVASVERGGCPLRKAGKDHRPAIRGSRSAALPWCRTRGNQYVILDTSKGCWRRMRIRTSREHPP